MIRLENINCFVVYDEKFEDKIFGGDKTDCNNEPRFYTQAKCVKKSWKNLKEKWTDKITMWQAITILEEVGKPKIHSYCAMD